MITGHDMKDFEKFSILEQSETVTSDSTTPFISPPIKVYDRTVNERNDEIFATQLTQEEFLEAIQEGKRKKWYRLRHAEYWSEKERMKPSTGDKKIKI